ncbi:hypothetical protein YC2023_070950 [Brassica napus]
MKRPLPSPFPIVTQFLNLSRVVEVFYKDGDIFTHPELTQDYVIFCSRTRYPFDRKPTTVLVVHGASSSGLGM